jgi:hypothetical protein
MAPHAGFDTEQVREKARKDLLYLIEGVSFFLMLRAILPCSPSMDAGCATLY